MLWLVAASLTCCFPLEVGFAQDAGEPAPRTAKPEKPSQPNPNTDKSEPDKFAALPWRKTAPEISGIANLLVVTPRIYSGGEPTSEEAFKALSKLGVQSIISVDGMPPNVKLAARFGIRYIHIPVQYRGIPDSAQAQLNKALTTTNGQLFIHCHHGKHRGPAAAAILAAIDGSVSTSEALDLLKVAGTAEKYNGLWRSVRELEASTIPAWDLPLSPSVDLPSTATIMAEIARDFEELEKATKLTARDRRESPLNQEQLLNRAVSLEEAFRELSRRNGQREGMRGDYLHIAKQFSQLTGKSLEISAKERSVLLHQIQERCDACHDAHRN